MANWTNDKLEKISLKIIEEGNQKSIRLRLLGGIAVYHLCKDIIAQYSQLQRTSYDIDFAARSEDTEIIEKVLNGQGFKPHKEFNFINASSRMLFSRDNLKVDIILDEFRMNHRWLIKERLFGNMDTIPLEDLILTKLQIVHPDNKDILDLFILGIFFSTNTIDMEYIKERCLSSWGFTYTVPNTCRRVIDYKTKNFLDFQSDALKVYMQIIDELSHAKKSFIWKARNIIGKQIRWYEVAEEPTI